MRLQFDRQYFLQMAAGSLAWKIIVDRNRREWYGSDSVIAIAGDHLVSPSKRTEAGQLTRGTYASIRPPLREERLS